MLTSQNAVLSPESTPEVASAILLLTQSLRTCQKQTIISKKLIEDKVTTCIAKARNIIGIRGHNFHRILSL